MLTTRQEIDVCPRRIFISIPGMWTPPGNRCMTEAARLAGFECVDLVYEPQAAAAYWLQKIKPSSGGMYTPGDRIQVLDVGGGTSDAIGYEVQEASDQVLCGEHSEGVPLKLVSLGDATGRLCGSEFINLAFLRWLPKYINQEHLKKSWPGGLSALRRQMNVSQDELDQHVETDFSQLKHSEAQHVRSCYNSGMPKMLRDLNLTQAEFLDRANTEFGRLKIRLDEREFQDPVQKIFVNGKPKDGGMKLDEDEDDGDDSALGSDTPERKISIKK